MTTENPSAPDNPPAFPMAVPTDFQFANDGMTLRDWFAGQALIGLCLSEPWVLSEAKAQAAYEVADALLAARTGGRS